MNQIERIEIGLTNGEGIRLFRKDIGIFRISNITRSISREAVNSILEYFTTDEFYLQVSSKANDFSSYDEKWVTQENLPFTRITQSRDIAVIEVHYKDGSKESIYPKWEGTSEYENQLQSSAINPHTGDLYIVVSTKNDVESIFSRHLTSKDDSHWTRYAMMEK